MILLSATEPLVPTYEARLGAARALTDQRTAAALMWVGGMVTTVPLLVIAVWRWAADRGTDRPPLRGPRPAAEADDLARRGPPSR